MALLSTQAQAKYLLRRSHHKGDEEKDENHKETVKKEPEVKKRSFVSQFCASLL